MKWCNARNVIIMDKREDYTCVYRRKKVYKGTDTRAAFIRSLDFRKLSGAFI